MTAKSTRILKEARPLVWPWLAVAIAGALPLVHGPQYLDLVTMVGFYLGIPVLATLAFGSEFQSRTFALVLSQPIERREIWREKLMVTVFAVVTAALVFSLTLGVQINYQYPHFFIFIAAWTLAIIASAAFWTLWTRSTMGGVVLNFGVLALIITWVDVASHLYDSPYSVEENSAAILRAALILTCYAGVMLWLGWRRIERFQVTGTMAGDDLVTAGPDLMPRALADLFRSRSRGAILNLLRKEFRLLRPVWLFTILTAVGWSGVTAFQVMREHARVKYLPMTAGAVGLSCALIIAILAGCLSLGEERTSGRHAWHLTLPVSARVQWVVKFLTALLAGALCAGVVPLLFLAAGKSLLGMSVLADRPDYPTLWFWSMLTLTAAAFWCSCAADGTVTAALWVVPVLAAIGFAPEAGQWAGRHFMGLLEAKFNLLGNFRLDVMIDHVLWPLHVPPPRTFFERALRIFVGVTEPYAYGERELGIFIPTVALAVVQSYRMFQKQAIAGTRVVVRRLLPLVLLTLGCSFALSGLERFTWGAAGWPWMIIHTTHAAIEKLLAESASQAKPMELSAVDLDNAYPLPKDTLKLLHNARITVTPEGPTGESRYIDETTRIPLWFYHATIHLEDGTDLTASFEREDWSVRIRWPGAAEDEPLWGR